MFSKMADTETNLVYKDCDMALVNLLLKLSREFRLKFTFVELPSLAREVEIGRWTNGGTGAPQFQTQGVSRQRSDSGSPPDPKRQRATNGHLIGSTAPPEGNLDRNSPPGGHRYEEPHPGTRVQTPQHPPKKKSCELHVLHVTNKKSREQLGTKRQPACWRCSLKAKAKVCIYARFCGSRAD
jgi:hypothetical protein